MHAACLCWLPLPLPRRESSLLGRKEKRLDGSPRAVEARRPDSATLCSDPAAAAAAAAAAGIDDNGAVALADAVVGAADGAGGSRGLVCLYLGGNEIGPPGCVSARARCVRARTYARVRACSVVRARWCECVRAYCVRLAVLRARVRVRVAVFLAPVCPSVPRAAIRGAIGCRPPRRRRRSPNGSRLARRPGRRRA